MALWKRIYKTWEEQRSNVVWAVVTILAAALVGFATTLTRGLTGWQQFGVVSILAMLLVWAVIASFRVAYLSSLLPSIEVVTVENLETRLRDWILNFRFRNQKLMDSPLNHFAYVITLPTGLNVTVSRPRNNQENYLFFSTVITMTAEQNAVLNGLPDNKRKLVEYEHIAECNKARVQASIVPNSAPIGLNVIKAVPITSNFTEYEFVKTLDVTQQDVLIISAQFNLCLHRVGVMPPSVSTPDMAALPPSPA